MTTSLVPVGGAPLRRRRHPGHRDAPRRRSRLTFSGDVNHEQRSMPPTWSSRARRTTRLAPVHATSLTWIDADTVQFNLSGPLTLPGTLDVSLAPELDPQHDRPGQPRLYRQRGRPDRHASGSDEPDADPVGAVADFNPRDHQPDSTPVTTITPTSAPTSPTTTPAGPGPGVTPRGITRRCTPRPHTPSRSTMPSPTSTRRPSTPSSRHATHPKATQAVKVAAPAHNEAEAPEWRLLPKQSTACGRPTCRSGTVVLITEDVHAIGRTSPLESRTTTDRMLSHKSRAAPIGSRPSSHSRPGHSARTAVDQGFHLLEPGPGHGQRILDQYCRLNSSSESMTWNPPSARSRSNASSGATPSPGYTRSASVSFSRGGSAG